MNITEFDDREQQLVRDRAMLWIERWREPTGAMTAARFDARVSLVAFGGVLSDAGADWLEPLLPRLLDAGEQLHFIDQGLLTTPNTKIRNIYMSTLVKRRADLARARVHRQQRDPADDYLGGQPDARRARRISWRS